MGSMGIWFRRTHTQTCHFKLFQIKSYHKKQKRKIRKRNEAIKGIMHCVPKGNSRELVRILIILYLSCFFINK